MTYNRLRQKALYWGKLILQAVSTRLGYYSRPDFLIVGTQKGGTSAISAILQQHSLIKGPIIKELHYFNNHRNDRRKGTWHYHRWFPLPFRVPEHGIVFETTPGYMFNPEAAERLHRYNPGLKLIVILRNPAERALSAWSMFHHLTPPGQQPHQREPRPFPVAMAEELEAYKAKTNHGCRHQYIRRGLYAAQLKRLWHYFPKEQILILENSELKNEFNDTLWRIFRFLQLPYEPLQTIESNVRRVKNHTQYAETMQQLKEFYHPYNEQLFEVIGKRYDWNDGALRP